jgi:hypothetical protein
MEESAQFARYQDSIRAKNIHSCNALLSRLVEHHGEAFLTVAPVVVMEPPAIPEPVAVADPPPPAVPEVVTEIEEGPRPVTIKEIQKCIAKHFDLSMTELLSSRRLAKIVRPRQIGFYLARKLTSRSLPEIGRKFGGKDHTTILHACKKVEERMAKDPQLAETVRHLEGMFA